jgi:hypothetical protein
MVKVGAILDELCEREEVAFMRRMVSLVIIASIFAALAWPL